MTSTKPNEDETVEIELVPLPTVRCICGRVHKRVTTPVVCNCGVKLEIRNHKRGGVQPWAVAPDEYDLGKRKYNKPAIVSWEWVEQWSLTK